MKCVLKTMTGLILFLGHIHAYGYVSIRSQGNGANVHWDNGANLTFRANTTNRSGVSAGDLMSIFTTSLSRWRQIAENRFSFLYYQGTDVSRYPNYIGSPQDNSIFFTSNASSSDKLSCGTIGLTQVWFDPNSGTANKADVRFNDECYVFSTNPGDTKTLSRIFIGDVATHEFGHALGLDHTQNLQSAMIYTAAAEMSVPSCDDQAGIANLYGTSLKDRTGALTGQVLSPTSVGVFGAHVSAISLERGVALASALTERDGSFRIGGLEPGNYTVSVEPYYPGAGSLGPFYKDMSSSVCPGGTFERTFAANANTLKTFSVTANSSVSINAITVSCSAPKSPFQNAEALAATAPELAVPANGDATAIQSVFTSGAQSYYLLRNVQGYIQARTVAFDLFSPVNVRVELLNASLQKISQTVVDNIFESSFFGSSSGYTNYDGQTSATIATPQNIYVRVTAIHSLGSAQFPSGNMGVSQSAFYILGLTRTQPSNVYAANARCANTDEFSAYSSSGEAPPLGGNTSTTKHSSGGCGTIRNTDTDPEGNIFRFLNFAGCLLLTAAACSFMKRFHFADISL